MTPSKPSPSTAERQLRKARLAFTRKWWRRHRGYLGLQRWVLDIWEFAIEPMATVRAVAASLALDGYPSRAPRRRSPSKRKTP